ncbi:MAG: carboxypeptidase-like regulatory domain-containing protein, partial [Terracidiphilus sp.]
MRALHFTSPKLWINRSKWACFAATFLLTAAAIPVCAQTDTGTIVGIVQDKSNARVPGATVNVTDTATSVTRTYKTNGDGEYEALQLIPGVYNVTVDHAGFSTAERKDITVNVQDRIQVDFVIGVSSVQQQVVVNEVTAELQTQSAEVNGVMQSQEVNDLPLNGRDYDALVLTQPGVFRDNTVSNPAEGLFSANGNLELQNYFQLDGIDNNSKSENLQEQSTQSVIPPPDALQEFVLQTRTYSTEFGTAAGAVVNVSTKSGTNQFHGDVWDYIQNGALNANTYF